MMTPPAIRDPEVLALVRLFDAERAKGPSSPGAYDHSPFAWLKPWPSSKAKGAIFESVVHQWCEGMGLTVEPTGDSDADRVFGGKRFEIKGSTPWAPSYKTYKFQQLRDQNYDAAICLGVSPFDAHCWVLSKEEILYRRRTGEIRTQHGGRSGKDTGWFEANPDAPPEWLSVWGESLAQAKRVLRDFVAAGRE